MNQLLIRTRKFYVAESLKKGYNEKRGQKPLLTIVSGWQDSNLRPPAPKAGAIPGYATPRKNGITFFCFLR